MIKRSEKKLTANKTEENKKYFKRLTGRIKTLTPPKAVKELLKTFKENRTALKEKTAISKSFKTTSPLA